VPSKQDQQNIHSAYATRVARVRSEEAKTPISGKSGTEFVKTRTRGLGFS